MAHVGTRSLAILAALLVLGTAAAGAAEPVTLQWSDLAGKVVGRKVELVLPGGVAIGGKARAVEPEGLRMEVEKTSDSKAQPKGDRLIPRASVSVLRVIEYRGYGRLWGTLGAMAAAAGVFAAAAPPVDDGIGIIALPAIGAAGTIGGGVGGYYAGKRLDRKVTEIRIAPDR